MRFHYKKYGDGLMVATCPSLDLLFCTNSFGAGLWVVDSKGNKHQIITPYIFNISNLSYRSACEKMRKQITSYLYFQKKWYGTEK